MFCELLLHTFRNTYSEQSPVHVIHHPFDLKMSLGTTCDTLQLNIRRVFCRTCQPLRIHNLTAQRQNCHTAYAHCPANSPQHLTHLLLALEPRVLMTLLLLLNQIWTKVCVCASPKGQDGTKLRQEGRVPQSHLNACPHQLKSVHAEHAHYNTHKLIPAHSVAFPKKRQPLLVTLPKE